MRILFNNFGPAGEANDEIPSELGFTVCASFFVK